MNAATGEGRNPLLSAFAEKRSLTVTGRREWDERRHWLRREIRVGGSAALDRTGDDKSLEENFIQELGFSLCNKLTPYLFMDATQRPPQELIQKAATAVTYRNQIMHALRNAAGAYKSRSRTNAELSDAFSAALQLYEFYRKASRRRFQRGRSFRPQRPNHRQLEASSGWAATASCPERCR